MVIGAREKHVLQCSLLLLTTAIIPTQSEQSFIAIFRIFVTLWNLIYLFVVSYHCLCSAAFEGVREPGLFDSILIRHRMVMLVRYVYFIVMLHITNHLVQPAQLPI